MATDKEYFIVQGLNPGELSKRVKRDSFGEAVEVYQELLGSYDDLKIIHWIFRGSTYGPETVNVTPQ